MTTLDATDKCSLGTYVKFIQLSPCYFWLCITFHPLWRHQHRATATCCVVTGVDVVGRVDVGATIASVCGDGSIGIGGLLSTAAAAAACRGC